MYRFAQNMDLPKIPTVVVVSEYFLKIYLEDTK